MKKQAVLAVFAIVLATGCVNVGDSTAGLEVTMQDGGGNSVVRVDDRNFRKFIEVEDSIVTQAVTGFLEANVRVRNRSKRDYPIQYKFEWFDVDGRAIQPGSRPWEQTTLHGGEAVTLAATAPEKGCVKFVAHLRRIGIRQ